MSLVTRLWHYADNSDYCQQLRDDCREAAQTIERLQRDMNRANRIAGKADRMYDAIRELQQPGIGNVAARLNAVIKAADNYDLALSDPEAESTDGSTSHE